MKRYSIEITDLEDHGKLIYRVEIMDISINTLSHTRLKQDEHGVWSDVPTGKQTVTIQGKTEL